LNVNTRLLPLSLAALGALACALVNATSPSQGTVQEIAADESPSPESFSLVVLHPSHGDLAALLAAHAQRAAELDRKPFVEFSAEWCPSCVILERSLADERLVEALGGVYLIRLDIDEWKTRLSGTDFVVLGVPAFFELDGDGVSTGRTITGAAWGPDLPENMAPVLQEFFGGASKAPRIPSIGAAEQLEGSPSPSL
jgi:thiol:disulfide interchange protein